MQLTELKTFLAIVENGSLVRASQQLNVTQSTVTARLKSLEMELGQTLVNRDKSGASLTAAGQRLQRYAVTISELWQQTRQEIALPDGLSSVCNIGCDVDLWSERGEVFFNNVRRDLPHVALSVMHGSRGDLLKGLKDGLIDVAFSYWPNTDPKNDMITMEADELVVVSSQENSPIKFDPNYVFVDGGEEFGQQHSEAYWDAGTARVSFSSAQLGLEYLLKRGGSAYLPRRMVKFELAEGRLFELNGPIFKRQNYLIVTKSARAAWPWFDDQLKMLD